MTMRAQIFPAIFLVAPPDSLEHFTDLSFDGEKPPGIRRVDRCKVFFMNNTVYVGVSTPEGPQIVFREQLSDYKLLENQHKALTTSGKIVVVKKDNNCGCGTTLKGWSPFGNALSSIKDPDA